MEALSNATLAFLNYCYTSAYIDVARLFIRMTKKAGDCAQHNLHSIS